MKKRDIFSTELMITIKISNYLTPKGAYNSNYSDVQTHYVLMLQEPLQIMPQ